MSNPVPDMKQNLVLVLDDEALIALDLAATVEDSGRDVLGPVFSLAKAFEAIETVTPEFALLDINVGKEQVWPLARALRERGTGLVFISGDLSPANLLAEFDDALRLHKPALPQHVYEALETFEASQAAAE